MSLAETGAAIGGQLFDSLKTILGDEWDRLSDLDKSSAESVSIDLASLHVLSLMGEDVTSAMKKVKMALALLNEKVQVALAEALRSLVISSMKIVATGLLDGGIAAAKKLVLG